MKHLILILIAVFLFSSAGFAVDNASDNLTLPHTFSAGETISSSKMNENFQKLVDAFNQLLIINDLNLNKKSIVIYQTDQTYNGDLGGMPGANNKCQVDTNIQALYNLGYCNNIQAVISTSSQQISDFNNLLSIDDNFNVITTERSEFTSNTSEFFNGTGGAMFMKFSDWSWTGTNNDGTVFNTNNCNNWSSSSNNDYGRIGKQPSSSNDLINKLEFNGGNAECNNEIKLLCICY